MSDSLFSQSWYRVAGLKPSLRSHAEIHRHDYRGAVWYVLEDPFSGRYHRLSASAHSLIGLMDGNRTVQEIWDTAVSRMGDEVALEAMRDRLRLVSREHQALIISIGTLRWRLSGTEHSSLDQH